MTSPNQHMCTGWGWPFTWNVSRGENATSVVEVYLSRDSGATFPEYLGSKPYQSNPVENKIIWRVTPPQTDNAKIKLHSHDSYGHIVDYIIPYTFTICGGCIRGDINHDSVYYTVADVVKFARWFVDSTDICNPDSVYGISPCDVNCDAIVSLSDLVFLVRTIIGDFVPCDEGPPYQPGPPLYAGEIEVESKRNNTESTISITSEYPIGALAFVFNTSGTVSDPVLITPNMQFITSIRNGKLKVLVWNENGESIPPGSHEILTISNNAELASARAADYDNHEFKVSVTTSDIAPSRFVLFQNYPNPFNPKTDISFILATVTPYVLRIYNVAGQLVRMYQGMGVPNFNTITWDGKDYTGGAVSSGVYFCHLQAGESYEVRKMILMK